MKTTIATTFLAAILGLTAWSTSSQAAASLTVTDEILCGEDHGHQMSNPTVNYGCWDPGATQQEIEDEVIKRWEDHISSFFHCQECAVMGACSKTEHMTHGGVFFSVNGAPGCWKVTIVDGNVKVSCSGC